MLRRSARSMVVVIAAAVPITATIANAQIGRSRVTSSEPGYWVGLSLGYIDGTSMTDAASSSTWRFGYTSQIRATLEKSLQPGTTLGIAAGFASVPLSYTASSTDPHQACLTACDARADLTQYTAFIRGGAGAQATGFRGMYLIEGGVTQYANFRTVTDDVKLAPSDGHYDTTFGFGFGFGYAFSPKAEFYAGQMFYYVLHQQISAASSSAPRLLTLRAGLRLGF